ncbi:histidine kinase [Corallococcus sp. H22C18031201]|nr:histidine kinase [Corallococcus sp. H22C18031201]
MNMPESDSMATADRFARSLDARAGAPGVTGVESLLRGAAASLEAPAASLGWWDEAGLLRSWVTPGLSAEAGEACSRRLMLRGLGALGSVEAPGAYVAEDLSTDPLLADVPEVRRAVGSALLALPLFLPTRPAPMGVLGVYFAQPRRFLARDLQRLSLHATLAERVLERERWVALEAAARLQAEESRQRFQLLMDAGALLAGPLDWEERVAAVVRLALGTFADGCAVDVTADEPEAPRRLASLQADPGLAPPSLEALRWRSDEARPALLDEVLRSGRSRMVSRVGPAFVEERSGGEVLWRSAYAQGLCSLIVAPLMARQRTLGVLTFVRGESRPPYGTEDLALAEDLASRLAVALDNARLLRQARGAEDSSRRSAARLHVLVQVSQLIAEAGLDLAQVLDVLTHKVSEAIGEACVLQLLSSDQERLEVVAVHHPRPESRALLEQALRDHPALPGEGVEGRVALSGQSLALPRLTAEELRLERAPAGLAYFERQGPQSLLVVPLGARGRVLGTLTVMRESPGREYSAEERALLESLGARAALAIDDARAYGAATEAVKVRDEVLSMAGHELKAPLNALQLQIHMLARTAREATAAGKLAERAERAARASQRMGLLIDDLLDVSRISAGRLWLRREEVDLAAVTRDTVSRMSEELVRAGCELRLEADTPAPGLWDRLRVEQVLVNLLSNAAKYGAGRPVAVSVSWADGWARVGVRDEGIGIAPEDHERIFERFERTVAAQHFKGLGLGLWISKRIVEALGGTLRVRSQQGQGSTFTLELPVNPPAQDGARATPGDSVLEERGG